MLQPKTKAEFDAALAEATTAGRTIVVDFAAEWCGPCKRIGPDYDKLPSEFPQVSFIRIDVDENVRVVANDAIRATQNKETAAAEGISAMPTFKAYRNRKEVASVQGADIDALRAMVKEHQGDKWSMAGAGHTLGSSSGAGGAAATGETEAAPAAAAPTSLSEREKRLAALAKRGL